MTPILKKAEDLVPSDYAEYPIWEFALDLEIIDDTLMRPVTNLPVDDLGNRIVGTKVRLANGLQMWADITNLDLSSLSETKRYNALSLWQGDEWIPFVPYHDFGAKGKAAAKLAKALNLPVESIFPISYDISDCCVGDPAVVCGTIDATTTDTE